MAGSSKAKLVNPYPEFCKGGMHSGVWKRNTVTSCWAGRKVVLATDEPAPSTCCCRLIRVGDEFFVAQDFGDPKETMMEYEGIWAQRGPLADAQA